MNRPTHPRPLLLAALLAILLALPARAAQLLYEGFNYPVGTQNIVGQTGGSGWNGPWQLIYGASADTLQGSLVAGTASPAGYDGFSTGNKSLLLNARRIGRRVDTSPTGAFGTAGLVDGFGRIGADNTTIYLSFLQQPDGTSFFYEFEFHRDDLGDPGRTAGIGNDQGGDNVNLRAPAGTHTPIGPGNTGVNLYVVRIDFKPGNDDVRVYMNPTSPTEPAVPTLTSTGIADMSFNGISFGAFVNNRTVMHDEVRIGQTWADVTIPPPAAPTITRHPDSREVFAGANVTFTVEASGNPAPTFQWYQGTTLLQGQTGLSLTLTNVQPGDAGAYHLVATNAGGPVSSHDANLTVIANPPALLAYEGFNYPTGTQNVAGQNGGTGWNGAWVLINNGSADVLQGSLLAGAPNSPPGYDDFSIGNKADLQNGRRVGRRVDTSLTGLFGKAGLVDSAGRIGADGTTLYLSFLQQPNGTSLFYEFEFHRDDLGDPGRIGGIGNDQPGDNVNLRAPAGTHTFIAPGNTNVNLYVVRIDFKQGNDDVRVYMNPTSATEPAVATLSTPAIADLSFNGISFGAFVNGRTVMHDELRFGRTWASVTSAPQAAPQITTQPQSRNVYAGSNTTLSVIANGIPAPAYQWYKGTGLLQGKTDFTLTLANVQGGDAGDYHVTVTNSQGSVTSDPATITVKPVAAGLLAYEGFEYPAGSANLPGNSGGFGWGGNWTAIGGGGESVISGSLVAEPNAPVQYDSHSLGNSVFLPNAQRDGRFVDTSPGGTFGSHGYVDLSGNIGADGKTIYLSFLQQPNGATAFYEFEFHRADLGDPGRIGGLGNDLQNGITTVNLRTAATQTPIGEGNTSVNFYVIRIDFKPGFDDVYVYMNPTSLDEPPTASLTMIGASDMSFNGLSFGAYLNGRTVNHDELRLGETWESVVPAAPPTTPIAGNLNATGVTSNAATIQGAVTRIGSDTPTVTLYYGTTDGGTDTGIWENSVALGPQTGAFSKTLTGLQPFTRYYFRAFAQNSSGGNWSAGVRDFATLAAPPVMANAPATEITIVAARLGATVTDAGGKPPVVTLYYGTVNGGTNPASWQHSVDLGALTDFGSVVVGGLSANTTYFYRVFGVNEGGGSWAPASSSFTTPVATLPVVVNRPATLPNGFSATLNGQVTSSGNAPTTVTIFYGPVDGGTNAASWAKSVDLGFQTSDFSKIVAGLNTSTQYFFRARAQNAAGIAWAASSASFSTTTFTPVTVYLNEFVANTDNDDPHVFRDEDGSPEDWIELYNPTGTAADIGGYYLTDEVTKLTKWRFPSPTIIPADGYLVVFASNKNRTVSGEQLHTNFKLAEEGEYLAFVQPNGSTVIKQFSPFPVVPEYWSYGLTLPSAAGNYLPFQLPTPGGPNNTSAGTPAGIVNFSLPSQAFASASVALTLTTTSPTAVIRYTLDRSVPSASSPIYSGPLTISGTTQVRARAFESGAGFAPGLVHSETYVKLGAAAAAFTSNLPVVVLNNFGGGRPTADRQMAWSMYSPKAASGNRTALTNAPDFTTRGRMRVRGSSSAGWPKYSMNIEAWDELDEDTPVSPLGMPAEADWILGSFYDSDPAMVRNPLIYELSNRIGRWAPHTKYVEVFANTDDGTVDYPGDYMGVYAIMEKPERGADRIPVERLNPDDLFEPKITGGYIIRVDRVAPGTAGWVTNRNFPVSEPYGSIVRLIYDYPEENPAPLPSIPPAQAAYIRQYVQDFEDAVVQPNRTNPNTGLAYTDYIDRDSWVDHGLLNIFAQNIDGQRLSAFMFKPRGGKLFAGPIWDFDLTMNSIDSRTSNPLSWTGIGEATNPLTWGWWKYIWADPDSWQKLTDRWAQLREGPMSDASVADQLAGYYAQLSEPAVRNFAKWPTIPRRDGPDADTTGSFLDEFDIVRTWLVQHTAWIDSQFVAKPVRSPLGGVAGLVTLTAAQGTIYYTLDGSDPRLPGGAQNPAALTVASGGSITISSGAHLFARAKMGALWSAPASGYYFTTTPATAGSVVVSELNYHPADPSPAELSAGFTDSDLFEFVELMNISNGNVDLGGSRFTAGVDFTFAPNTVLTPGQRTIVVANRAAFAARYPSITSASIAGEYGGDHFDNAGEFVRLESASGAEILSFTYGVNGGWPADADGAGRSLVLSRPGSNPDPNSPANWHASATVNGTPLTSDALGYAAWKTAAGIASDTADGDRDGLVALVEYSLGTDPARPDASTAMSVQQNALGQWLVIVRRSLLAEETDFALQVSSGNLTSFADSPFVVDARTVSGNTEFVTCRLTNPPNTGKMFVRARWFTVP